LGRGGRRGARRRAALDLDLPVHALLRVRLGVLLLRLLGSLLARRADREGAQDDIPAGLRQVGEGIAGLALLGERAPGLFGLLPRVLLGEPGELLGRVLALHPGDHELVDLGAVVGELKRGLAGRQRRRQTLEVVLGPAPGGAEPYGASISAANLRRTR